MCARSWTYEYNAAGVDLMHASPKGREERAIAIAKQAAIELAMDLHGYQESGEFDLLAVCGQRNERTYECCPNVSYPDLTFELVLRREPLFYLVNLVMPCAGISFLAVLVFYLPVCPVALLLYTTYL